MITRPRARPWRSVAAQLLIGSLTLPIGLIESVILAPKAFAADQRVVLSELQPTGNGFIELQNDGTDTVNLENWSIWSRVRGEVVTLDGTLAPNEFRVVKTNDLKNSGDTVTLKTSTGDLVQHIEYGDTTSAHVPAPRSGQSIGRIPGSGVLVSNTTPTPGSPNQSPALVLPATNTGISQSATNPINTINATTEKDALIHATVPAGATEFTALLIDQSGRMERETVPTNGAGDVLVTIRTTRLDDGLLTLRTFSDTIGETSMYWSTGNQILKDTQTPDSPVITSPTENLTTATTTTLISGTAEAGASVSIWHDTQNLVSAISNGNFSLTAPLQTGKNELAALVTDAAGNQSRLTKLPTITSTGTTLNTTVVPAPEDLRARTLTESRVQLTWTLPESLLQQVHHFAVYSDDRTGIVNFSNPLAVTTGKELSLTTLTLPKGTHQFVVRSVNGHGDQSSNTNSDTATVMGFQSDQSLRGGQELLDFRPEQPLTMRTAPATTNRGRVSAESLGHNNPVREVISGYVAIGNHYELTSTNSTVFPLEIQIYYTAADLAAANVTNERQLTGLHFFNTSTRTWQPLENTGVNTTDILFEGTQYAGYFYATTSHLTTIVGVADLTDPSIPSLLTGEAGDGRVKLTWQQQTEAAGYWVRYRKATNIDTIPYTTVFLSSATQTSHLVTGLANGTLYEFGVATEDKAGNVSDFAVIEQTPTAGSPTTDFITPATAKLTASGTTARITTAEVTSTSSSSDSNSSPTSGANTPEGENPTDEDGAIKSGTDAKDDTQSARSLVTLLIVLVAAAAGFGGYYGYQWWTARPEDFDEPEPIRSEDQPPKKPEKADKPAKTERPGGRW